MTRGPQLPPVNSVEMKNEAYANGSDETIPQVNSMTDMAGSVLPVEGDRQVSVRSYMTIAILCIVNLLNYMDRLAVAGVLVDVKKFYDLNDSEAGLLQTSFICSYMVLAPIFGYLGDRYNRKMIIAFGIFFWSLTTLAGSFVPAHHFWWFLVCRALVGVGEASYSTIAPTIIADVCSHNLRSSMLAVFYFAIPAGSGMGYMVGSHVAKAFGSWEWSLRVTPILGLICVLLVLIVVEVPPRGNSDGGEHLELTSWKDDIKAICKIRSYVWSSVGFTCVAFVAGALSWWGPYFLYHAIEFQGVVASMEDISLIFGIITVIAGVLGVAFGSGLATVMRKKYPRADPLVCALGILCSTPFLFFACIVSQHSSTFAYILIFFGETALCMTWAVVTDIMLYVVIPTRRSTAAAFQILVSHAFGDAGSPYIIGAVADAIKEGRPANPYWKYTSMEYAMFITCFVNILGGLAFLVTSWYIVDDKTVADSIIQGGDFHVTEELLKKKCNGYQKVQLIPNGNGTTDAYHILAKKALQPEDKSNWV